MMDNRRSPATQKNVRIRQQGGTSSNAEWFGRRVVPGAVVLIGGARLSDFRVRVAQSHLRRDLLPSFWSDIGLAVSSKSFVTVPFALDDASRVPETNAVSEVAFKDIDSVAFFPNVAVLELVKPTEAIRKNVDKLKAQRSAVDLPTMLLAWLGYVWGAGDRRNPLLQEIGLPSAVLVETAFAMSGIELTPGLASKSSCPEAVWQSALWWQSYYESSADIPTSVVATDTTAKAADAPVQIIPRGAFRTLQRAAAVLDPGDARKRRK
jgi:hypothetical protein